MKWHGHGRVAACRQRSRRDFVRYAANSLAASRPTRLLIREPQDNIMKFVKMITMIIIVLAASSVALLAIDELRGAYPTKLLCGRVILHPDDAIKMAARSIVAWPKEPLGGLTPEQYVKTHACCSARISKSFSGNWDVSIILPTECATTEEYALAVRICGGGVSVIGSSPSTLDSDNRKYCR